MTKVELFNTALSTLGVELLSKETDKSRNGEYCRSFYPMAARAVLTSFDWNCARRRILLNAIDVNAQGYNADLTDFEYQYVLPSDWLKMVSINDSPETKRLIEAGYLYCDSNDIKLVYTSREIEPEVAGDELPFTESMCNAIGLYIAYRLSLSIVKNSPAQLLYQEYTQALLDAQGQDAMDKEQDQIGGWIE